MHRLLFFLLTTFATATLAANGGFLFVTFTGEKTPTSEQIYFAVSTNGRRLHLARAKGLPASCRKIRAFF